MKNSINLLLELTTFVLKINSVLSLKMQFNKKFRLFENESEDDSSITDAKQLKSLVLAEFLFFHSSFPSRK